jgi:hypothetical protein
MRWVDCCLFVLLSCPHLKIGFYGMVKALLIATRPPRIKEEGLQRSRRDGTIDCTHVLLKLATCSYSALWWCTMKFDLAMACAASPTKHKQSLRALCCICSSTTSTAWQRVHSEFCIGANTACCTTWPSVKQLPLQRAAKLSHVCTVNLNQQRVAQLGHVLHNLATCCTTWLHVHNVFCIGYVWHNFAGCSV